MILVQAHLNLPAHKLLISTELNFILSFVFLLLHFEIIWGIRVDTYLFSKILYLELEAESNFSKSGLDPRIYVKNKCEFFRFQHSSH